MRYFFAIPCGARGPVTYYIFFSAIAIYLGFVLGACRRAKQCSIIVPYCAQHPVTLQQKRQILAACPQKVFTLEDNGELEVCPGVVDLMSCEEAIKCCTELGIPGYLSVNEIPDVFYFTVESVGSRTPESIVAAALKIWWHKLKTFNDDIEDLHDDLWERMTYAKGYLDDNFRHQQGPSSKPQLRDPAQKLAAKEGGAQTRHSPGSYQSQTPHSELSHAGAEMQISGSSPGYMGGFSVRSEPKSTGARPTPYDGDEPMPDLGGGQDSTSSRGQQWSQPSGQFPSEAGYSHPSDMSRQ